MSREDSLRLVDAVRELQPDCLINSRIGNGVGDYDTLGDQEMPLDGARRAVGDHRHAQRHVGLRRARPQLEERPRNWSSGSCAVVGLGGNYMLNVGPTGLGEIPADVGAHPARGRRVDRAATREAIYGDERVAARPAALGRVHGGDGQAVPARAGLARRAGRCWVPGLQGARHARARCSATPASRLQVEPQGGARSPCRCPSRPPDSPADGRRAGRRRQGAARHDADGACRATATTSTRRSRRSTDCQAAQAQLDGEVRRLEARPLRRRLDGPGERGAWDVQGARRRGGSTSNSSTPAGEVGRHRGDAHARQDGAAVPGPGHGRTRGASADARPVAAVPRLPPAAWSTCRGRGATRSRSGPTQKVENGWIKFKSVSLVPM